MYGYLMDLMGRVAVRLAISPWRLVALGIGILALALSYSTPEFGFVSIVVTFFFVVIVVSATIDEWTEEGEQ